MNWSKFFGKPTISLDEARDNNKSKRVGKGSSFTNSNGNTYYITKFVRDEPIPVVEKISLMKKISSYLKN